MKRLISAGNFVNHSQNLNTFRHLLPFSTSATTTLTDSFANYLVDSLGFSHRQALSASTRLYQCRKFNHFNFVANAFSVVTLFKTYGFNDTHLTKLISFDPRVLFSNVHNTIAPKLQLFLDQGFSRSDLIRVFSVNPQLLLSGPQSSIFSAVQVLRRVLVSDANVIAVLRKSRRHSFNNICRNLSPNIDLLTSYEIPIDTIRRHLVKEPMTFLRNPEKLKEILIRVESKLGIPRDAHMFLYGVRLLCGCTEETIESKCQMFKSFRWTQSDIDTYIMKNVSCFTMSDENIKKRLDFLMNELQLEPAYLLRNTAFLTYSLEKTIMPRHKVLLLLKETGLLKKNRSLYGAIRMSESRFVDMFVIPFKEVHQVYATQTGCSIKMLTKKRADHLY